jgi:RNA polymerase sigma-70 factor (ECF subfamily)
MPDLYTIGPQEERILVQKVLSGDPEAKEAFCSRFSGRLLATARALLGHQDSEAEDMVQESLMAGLQALPGFEFRSSLYTWLNHICVNFCLKVLRKRQRTLVQEDREIQRITDLTAETGDPGRSALLQRGLHSMDARCRNILAMRFELDMEYGAISRALKIPIGTVMSRLSRCKRALKDALLKIQDVGHG